MTINIYNNMMKRLLSITFLLALHLLLWAQIPVGYYSAEALDGKKSNELRLAFSTVISNGHTAVTYTPGVWEAFATTDVRPTTGKIWDMYSNCTFTLGVNQDTGSGGNTECDVYNREHTVPQSWFGSQLPMHSDLFHIYATDKKVNAVRADYLFGEVSSTSYISTNGSKLGSSSFPGYVGTVFEPIDEYKGDFARTYFYMATRYADVCGSWSGGATSVFSATNGLTSYAINLFLKWSRLDPVSEKEIARNNAVYNVQNNRNPFIDFAGLEEFIWGNKNTLGFSVSGTPIQNKPNISTSQNIAGGTTLDFGTSSTAVRKQLLVKTTGITGDLSVNISGTGFSSMVSSISKNDAQNGYLLEIVFTPTTAGNYSGTLSISGGGLSPSYQINLSGKR